MKRALIAFLCVVFAFLSLFSCGDSKQEDAYDLSSAEGVCFFYDTFATYITDESQKLRDAAIDAAEKLLNVKVEQIDVDYDAESSGTIAALLENKERIEINFTSPVKLVLNLANGETFVLNDYTSIVFLSEGNELYLKKDGVYSRGTFKSFDLTKIKEVMDECREEAEKV